MAKPGGIWTTTELENLKTLIYRHPEVDSKGIAVMHQHAFPERKIPAIRTRISIIARQSDTSERRAADARRPNTDAIGGGPAATPKRRREDQEDYDPDFQDPTSSSRQLARKNSLTGARTMVPRSANKVTDNKRRSVHADLQQSNPRNPIACPPAAGHHNVPSNGLNTRELSPQPRVPGQDRGAISTTQCIEGTETHPIPRLSATLTADDATSSKPLIPQSAMTQGPCPDVTVQKLIESSILRDLLNLLSVNLQRIDEPARRRILAEFNLREEIQDQRDENNYPREEKVLRYIKALNKEKQTLIDKELTRSDARLRYMEMQLKKTSKDQDEKMEYIRNFRNRVKDLEGNIVKAHEIIVAHINSASASDDEGDC
ncbi:hypothetical protein BDV19DRAFT_392068 [Aspergillus venezuelensis]